VLADGRAQATAKSALRSPARILAAVAILGMVGHGLAMTITGPVLAQIMGDFAIKETAAGLLLAAGSFGFMVGCLVGGFVTDRIGLKPVLVAAWLVVAGSLVSFTVAPSYALLILMHAFIGAGSGVVETGLNVLPTQLGGGAGLMNVVHVGYGVGALSAPLIAGALLERGASWAVGYWLIAAVPSALALVGLSVRMPAAPRHAAVEEHHATRDVLRQPLVLLSSLALFFYVAAELSVSNWVVLFVSERFPLTPFMASLSLSTFWMATLSGRLLQGPLSQHVCLPRLIVASAAVFGAGLLGLALAPVPQLAYCSLVIAGLGASGIYPDVMVFVNRRYPRQIGVVTGVLSTVAAAGSFTFQPIVGRVAESLGLQIAFLGVAACTVVVAASYLPVLVGRVE